MVAQLRTGVEPHVEDTGQCWPFSFAEPAFHHQTKSRNPVRGYALQELSIHLGDRSPVAALARKQRHARNVVERDRDLPAWNAVESARQKLRHRVQMVDVIRRRVAGEPHDLEPARAHLAQLLHAAGSPTQNRRASKRERAQEPVRRLRGAREGARENLGVGDDESLLAACRCPRKIREGDEVRRVDRTAFVQHGSFRHVRRVHSIEQQHRVDGLEVARIAQNRPYRTMSS
jgi:hypothetical protein